MSIVNTSRTSLPARGASRLPRWRLSLAACALACASGWAIAQPAAPADLPGRIASIDALQGSAHVQGADDPAPRAADASWPVTTGDQVWTDGASRLELNTSGASLRLAGATTIDLTRLDDSTAQVKLTRGTLSVSVRNVAEGERYEVDTPNLALVLTQPGEWRIDVDPAQGITRVGARRGQGTLYGQSGQAQTVAAPDRRDYVGQDLAQAQGLRTLANDDFERWTLARENALEDSVSARYVSADMPGIQQLDSYGSWRQDGSLGPVWFPSVTQTDWAPYRYGRWDWVEPWGWTWVDDAPWGFAPSHYGRWTQIDSRWAWVPGRVPHRRPTYAPALVAFVGSNGGNSITLTGGAPAVAWFPLAPGEAWRPPYHASAAYVARLNHGRDSTDYRFYARPAAVTAWRSDDFGRRHSQRPAPVMVGAAALANARPIAVPYVAPQWARGGSGIERTAWRGPQTAPDASLADRVRQDEWARSQQALEARQQDAIRRQRELQSAQQRFQPGYGAPQQFVRDDDDRRWRDRDGYRDRDRDRDAYRDNDRDGRRWGSGGQDERNRQAEEQRRLQDRQREIREQQQRQDAQRQRDRAQELRNEQEVQRRQQDLQRRQLEAGRAQTQQQQNQQQLHIQQQQNVRQLERNRRTGSDVFVPPAINQNDRP